jgi:flagellar assembly protein FliH
VLDRLAHTLAELSSLRSRIRRDAEKDLVKLAIAIARRVLHREVTIDPESIEGLIKVALEKLQSRDVCKVRVHPAHAEFIKASFDRISNSKTVELIVDPSLRCGDVLFETSHGTLDASIEAQLSEIERGFADRLQR